MIGKTLSHYKVMEKIGAGSMGEFYRARDTKLDRYVAIKVLPEKFTSDGPEPRFLGRSAPRFDSRSGLHRASSTVAVLWLNSVKLGTK